MIKTMNYLNKNGEVELVDVLGYVVDSINYCEAYTEEKGYFIVPTNKLIPFNSKYTVVSSDDGFKVINCDTGETAYTHSFIEVINMMK